MIIEIWEDVTCPWCYIGERRLEAALEDFPHNSEVQIIRHSFELNPSAPAKAGKRENMPEMLSAKYGIDLEAATRREAQIADLAKIEGLTINPDRITANTRDAHRMLHLASDYGLQTPLTRLLFAAHFTDGKDISDPDVLMQLTGQLGIEANQVRMALAGDAYVTQVEADEHEAQVIGLSGVPLFVVDRRYGMNGAQPTAVFRELLEKAWEQRTTPTPAAESSSL
jgi:predicted DsbA family dithiol-disulfide isomerase